MLNVQKRFKLWIKKRHLSATFTLAHHNIYVLPSKLGWLFAFFIVLLFVLGVNYQNNLLLLSSYLFAVILVVALLIGFSNLNGLKLQVTKKTASFAPHAPSFDIRLITTKPKYLLTIESDHQGYDVPEVASSEDCTVSLALNTRGLYALPLLRLQSDYPFGLVKIWSYWCPAHSVHIYPEVAEHLHFKQQVDNTMPLAEQEFGGLNQYQPGDAPQRIAWKHFAKSGVLQTKIFAERKGPDAQLIFDFNSLEGSTEYRLSVLTRLIVDAYRNGEHFTLKLPCKNELSGKDADHYQACLESLSVF
ncbi:DUF58 domain-containing protein [Pseudoalteromonas fenneropenaei]|uniref:DUF58 domain-containing protein n=1 Tax=Pseudoalteromonas fenneropenaei TaxID=1737459 RepID=A0ABV7CFH7_9GAMM